MNMNLEEIKSNYYEVLEVEPSATQQEIRQSYLRLKIAYGKDSLALYSLIEDSEKNDFLSKLEIAYQILSDENKRRIYDQNFYSTDKMDGFLGQPKAASLQKQQTPVTSIDRVPPMQDSFSGEDLLIAPSTDFSSEKATSQTLGIFEETSTAATPHAATQSIPTRATPVLDSTLQKLSKEEPLPELFVLPESWMGTHIKEFREKQGVSIEEMSSFTRISKRYLFALESEDFEKLPAAPFVRGFVTQVAKRLKLPFEKVTTDIMNRFSEKIKS